MLAFRASRLMHGGGGAKEIKRFALVVGPGGVVDDGHSIVIGSWLMKFDHWEFEWHWVCGFQYQGGGEEDERKCHVAFFYLWSSDYWVGWAGEGCVLVKCVCVGGGHHHRWQPSL